MLELGFPSSSDLGLFVYFCLLPVALTVAPTLAHETKGYFLSGREVFGLSGCCHRQQLQSCSYKRAASTHLTTGQLSQIVVL